MRRFGKCGLLTKVIVGIGILSFLVFLVIDNDELILEEQTQGDSPLVPLDMTASNSTESIRMKGLPRKSDHHHIQVASSMASVQVKGSGHHTSSTTSAPPSSSPTKSPGDDGDRSGNHTITSHFTEQPLKSKDGGVLSVASPSGSAVKFSSYRYYIYEEESITRKKYLSGYRKANLEPNDRQLDHIVTDARAEDAILAALGKHSWRTTDPTKADFFIIPTPIATLLAAGGGREKATFFDETIANLTAHPIFQSYCDRHILVSLHWVAFNTYPLYFNDFVPALSRNYAKLVNVTVATHLDAPAIRRSFRYVQDHNISLKAYRGYHHIFADFRQATRSSFSLGLWASDTPLLPASYESWKQKSTSVFYHTRLKDSGSGSTPYRHGPLNLTLASLPNNSSMGLDIPPTKWLEEFTDSQFCLSIRGDTPHTHTLLRAVRVGCIPVVVSNLYPIFAPTLKSTLAMEDFCIFINEYDFRMDMGGELRRLATLDEAYLRNKTKYLAWAQRVIFPDDEVNSLFVPAFFKEAAKAVKRISSEKDAG